MPTLLDFCGLDVPRAVEGRRLPFKAGDARRPFAYSEYGAGGPEFTWEHARTQGQPKKLGLYGGGAGTEMAARAMRNRESAGHLRMIRTHAHKLVRDSNGDVEFYDLEKDPDEFENVHDRPEYRAAEQELEKDLAGNRL
jgi:arylsulfatase A-like enzyme